MRKLAIPLIVLIALAGIALYASAFIVKQGEKALVLQLGEIVQEDVNPGLHFKVPFISRTYVFDTRIRTMDGDDETVIVRGDARIGQNDQAPLDVDYYINWQITDVKKFYQSTGGDIRIAENLMTQRANKALKEQFGRRNIQQVVSDTVKPADEADQAGQVNATQTSAAQIQAENEEKSFAEEVADYANENLGVRVSDVRVERIDLPKSIIDTVYERMVSAWEEQSEAITADGERRAIKIRAETKRKAIEIKAKAQKRAEELRGKADADAAKTYADVYNQDPEFYRFYRSLIAYEKSLTNGDNVLVLEPDSEFFDYLKSSGKR